MRSLRPLIACLLRAATGDRLLAVLALAMAGPEGQPERSAAMGSR